MQRRGQRHSARRTVTVIANRYHRKWRQIPFSDRLNLAIATASFFTGGLAIVLTVVALRLGVRQEFLAARQTDLSEVQGRLAEQQTALSRTQFSILERQLQKEAKLSVSWSTVNSTLHLAVSNTALVELPLQEVEFVFYGDVATVACVDAKTKTSIDPYMEPHVFRLHNVRLPAEDRSTVMECSLTPTNGASTEGVRIGWHISAKDQELYSASWKVLHYQANNEDLKIPTEIFRR